MFLFVVLSKQLPAGVVRPHPALEHPAMLRDAAATAWEGAAGHSRWRPHMPLNTRRSGKRTQQAPLSKQEEYELEQPC